MRCSGKFLDQVITGLRRQCRGHTVGLVELAADPKGHQLFVADFSSQDGIAVLCMRCGAWATEQFRLLKEDCARQLTARRKLDRDILLGGRHPKRGDVHIDGFVPLHA